MTRKKYIKCVVSVTIGLILSLFLTSDITSDFIISLIGGGADFEVSDFYNRIDAGKHEKAFNPDIVIVEAGHIGRRDSIASLIDIVATHDPKVIGVDMLFQEPKDRFVDSLLLEALLRNQEKLVAAVAVRGNGTPEGTYIDANIFIDSLSSDTYGAVNLVAIPGGIVRSFMPEFRTTDGRIPSFAAAIASHLTTPGRNQGTSLFRLRYSNDRFLSIHADSLGAQLSDLKGKIVLIGSLDNPADRHRTPLGTSYPGVLIHAEIISTMLSGDCVSEGRNFLDILLALLISFFLCWVYVRLDNNNAQNLILRLLLITVVTTGLIIGCILYIVFNLYIDIAMILLVIALSQLILDIWYGFEVFSKWRRKSKLKPSKAAICMMVALIFFPCSAAAKSSYSVYEVKGTVTSISSGRSLVKGTEPSDDEMLDLSKNRELTLYDKGSGKLYVSTSQDRATPADIVKAAKRQSNSIIKRIYDEVLKNIRNKDSETNRLIGATQGAIIRDDGELMNANTEFIYSLLCSSLPHNKNFSKSEIMTLSPNFVNDDQVWWSIRNNSSKLMFVNILVKPKGNERPVFLFECSTEMPSLIVAPDSLLELPEELFLYSGRDYLLIASESPFDCQDIESFFRLSEDPVPLDEMQHQKPCIITVPESFEKN